MIRSVLTQEDFEEDAGGWTTLYGIDASTRRVEKDLYFGNDCGVLVRGQDGGEELQTFTGFRVSEAERKAIVGGVRAVTDAVCAELNCALKA